MKNEISMKNNTFFKLFIIILLAMLLRLWFIDKPEGLWNDEYVSWYIASKENFSDFFSRMLQNCHMPFYYLYLKVWMMLFNDSDISLRMSSVVPSLGFVLIMFFAGRNIKDYKFGLFTAFLAAMSSFCIYFAQEIRLYSLLLLFSGCAALYFIKTIRKQSGLNYFLYFLFNALICMTHTLGIIFCFFNIAAFFTYLYHEKGILKEKIKSISEFLKYLLPFIIVVLIISPFMFIIVSSKSLSQFWADFSLSRIFFTFTDYFSPVQTNIINSPDSVVDFIFNHGKVNFIFVIFGIIPAIIAVYAIYNAVKQNNKTINFLLASSGLYFLLLIAISFAGKMILITKYSCEIYPVLIIAFAYGLLSLKKKYLKSFLIFLFITLNLFYIFVSDDAAPKRARPEGHRAATELIKNSRLNNSDFVVLTYYDIDKLERYISKSKYNFSSINKFNFNYIVFNNDDYYQTIKDGKVLYRDNFIDFPNKPVIKYMQSNYICKMKKGDRIGILFLESVSFLSNEKIQEIVDDDEKYKKTPFIFLVFSSLKNSILYSFKNDFKIDSITQSGDWSLFVFEKKN